MTAEETAAETPPAEESVRERIGDKRYTGLVIEWRGYMGWIHPLVKIDHPLATKHQGRVYINTKDMAEDSDSALVMKEGRVVDFYVYQDHDGLGAEECRPRSVIRLTLPHGEANRAVKHSPQWSEYLTDSEYYPTYEADNNVLLRKYAWPMPFALFELWGHPEDLAKAAVGLVAKSDAEGVHIRLLVPEDSLTNVSELPTKPKISDHMVVTDPVACRSLTIQSTKDEAKDCIKAFVKAMTPPLGEKTEEDGAEAA